MLLSIGKSKIYNLQLSDFKQIEEEWRSPLDKQQAKSAFGKAREALGRKRTERKRGYFPSDISRGK